MRAVTELVDFGGSRIVPAAQVGWDGFIGPGLDHFARKINARDVADPVGRTTLRHTTSQFLIWVDVKARLNLLA